MPRLLLPCLQPAFWPECLLLYSLMKPAIPLSQTAICQPKQAQLCLKNVKQKIILQAMSNCCVYMAISAPGHYHQTKRCPLQSHHELTLLARSWETAKQLHSYPFNKNCSRRRPLSKAKNWRVCRYGIERLIGFKVRTRSFSFNSHIQQATRTTLNLHLLGLHRSF